MNYSGAKGSVPRLKIYLAGGPPNSGKGLVDWRLALTNGNCATHPSPAPTWDDSDPWHPCERSIFSKHTYTGPFFDSTCSGYLAEGDKHAGFLCMSAILQSNLVYLWLERDIQPDVMFELGFAMASEIPVYASYTSAKVLSPFCSALLNPLHCRNPAEGLDRVIRSFEGADPALTRAWRPLASKYDGQSCLFCGQGVELGSQIFWHKTASGRSEVAHHKCFLRRSPGHAVPDNFKSMAVDVLREQVEELQEENERLVETLRTLV